LSSQGEEFLPRFGAIGRGRLSLEASGLGAILTPLAHGRAQDDGVADPAKPCTASNLGNGVLLARNQLVLAYRQQFSVLRR
jgi:hypothetical protein